MIFFPQMGVDMVRVVGQQCMVEQEVLGEAVKRNDSSYVVFERWPVLIKTQLAGKPSAAILNI